MTVCMTEFCKVSRYQKISLLAIAMLRGVIPVMLKSPECSLTVNNSSPDEPMDDGMIRFWFPVIFGFYDIIMNGEDLEVRRLYVKKKLFLSFSLTSYIELWIHSFLHSKHMDPVFQSISGIQFVKNYFSQFLLS